MLPATCLRICKASISDRLKVCYGPRSAVQYLHMLLEGLIGAYRHYAAPLPALHMGL